MTPNRIFSQLLSQKYVLPLFSIHRLVRYGVNDVCVSLLGTVYPPSSELCFSYQGRDCGRVLPCLGRALLNVRGFLDQAFNVTPSGHDYSASAVEKGDAAAPITRVCPRLNPFANSASFRIHLKPARSVFSNALNFCRSAIAVLVRSP